MPRKTCPICLYPINTCVCRAVKQLNPKTSLYVMQHPSEIKAAKNTIRLAKLCIPELHIYTGEQPADFKDLIDLPPADTFLLYPDENAQPIETLSTERTKPVNLIILDGTWKKTYKLLMLNPWLKKFRTLSFNNLPENQYVIRKAKRSDSLSSLEAIAYSLEVIENLETQPLYNTLHKMMESYKTRGC